MYKIYNGQQNTMIISYYILLYLIVIIYRSESLQIFHRL